MIMIPSIFGLWELRSQPEDEIMGELIALLHRWNVEGR
jgi:hypothetical protein